MEDASAGLSGVGVDDVPDLVVDEGVSALLAAPAEPGLAEQAPVQRLVQRGQALALLQACHPADESEPEAVAEYGPGGQEIGGGGPEAREAFADQPAHTRRQQIFEFPLGVSVICNLVR